MKLTTEQQTKRDKLEKILRYDEGVIFNEEELELVLDKVIKDYEDEVLNIIMSPYLTLLRLKLVDNDRQYSYKNNI